MRGKIAKQKISLAIATALMIIGFIIILIAQQSSKLIKNLSPEIARSMSYPQVQSGEDAIENTKVKFDAYFLRDLDGDGYAEQIRGTCREVGEEDILYIQLQVPSNLKNGKIEINGKNFYLQSAIPKDSEVKENSVGNNIKTITLNDMTGTNRLFIGKVRSGDYSYSSTKNAALNNNINNYSVEDNEIILTGISTNEQGEDIEIRKVVNLAVDWHGVAITKVPSYYRGENKNQTYDIEGRVKEEENIVDLDFKVNITEETGELLLSKVTLIADIPELGGFTPSKVEAEGSNIDYSYDENTKRLTITREAVLSTGGKISKKVYDEIYNNIRYSEFRINLEYPLEAYESLGEERISLRVPVYTYYEGYNNYHDEFENPYVSNCANEVLTINYEQPKGLDPSISTTVGTFSVKPTGRYFVTKENALNIYKGIRDESINDTYCVRWMASSGTNGGGLCWRLKETQDGEAQVYDKFIKKDNSEVSLENIATFKGVYFSGAADVLGENGWIKVYDEETGNLVVTFTKDNWGRYSANKPYYYENEIKNIRIETSEVEAKKILYVYNIKSLNNKAIIENFTREEFEYLEYIKTRLYAYLSDGFYGEVTHKANYETPVAIANVGLKLESNDNVLSTQYTEENAQIIIEAKKSERDNNAGWINGSYLVKLPSDILTIDVNSVEIDNQSVNIINYELIENNGEQFIKIMTENNNLETQGYKITITADITPDPRTTVENANIELYAATEGDVSYYYGAEDVYDVNSNQDVNEIVNKTTYAISLIPPQGVVTNQIISGFDDANSIVVSPQVAEFEPIYANVNNASNEVNIGIQIKSRSEVEEVKIIGKIPFEGNTYVIKGEDLGSGFTAQMKAPGITIPNALIGKVTVYYSENENPSRELGEDWKTSDQITNWENVKCYLIDFEDTVLQANEEYTFNYVAELPNGTEFNNEAFSQHAVFCYLNTNEGKHLIELEGSKAGIRIAQKYNLELTKFQKGKEKKISGATYSITEVLGENSYGKTKSATTDANGLLTISGLYMDKTYEIKEIRTTEDYELNSDTIIFKAEVDSNGTMTVNKTSGTTKANMTAEKSESEGYKVTVQVEDEAKAKLELTKKEQGTENVVSAAIYKITGEGLPASGKRLKTNNNGQVNLSGLKIGEEYTLEEISSEGYYLASPVKFIIANNEGAYSIEVTEGNTRDTQITENDSLPIANITVNGEKIPTYNLEITKIKKVTTAVSQEEEQQQPELTYLAGAKFRLFKDGERIADYITDENGQFTINNLYQYVDGKDFNATYVLKEILPPEGYVKIKDIEFKVQEVEGTLKFIEKLENGQTEKQYTSEAGKVNLILEDSPSFKLKNKDGETAELLQGHKFAIYNIDEGEQPARNNKGEIIGELEVINGVEYYVLLTDENGELTADLPEGFYKAVEVEALDKYDISECTYYFGIGASKEPEETMVIDAAKSTGENSSSEMIGVAGTTDGGYVEVGEFVGTTLSIGGYRLESIGNRDVFVAKHAQDGAVQWVKTFGTDRYEYAYGVVATNDGGFAVAVDLRNTYVEDLYIDGKAVIKFNSDGTLDKKATKRFLNGGYIQGITTTPDGKITVWGDCYDEEFYLEEIKITRNEGDRFYIATYDLEGNVDDNLTRSFLKTTNINTEINSLIVTNDGGFAVAGGFYSAITIGEETIESNGQSDCFLIKYDANGEIESNRTKIFGEAGSDAIEDIAEINNGAIVAIGHFSGDDITLGKNQSNEDVSLEGNGYDSNFIAKYNADGTVDEDFSQIFIEGYYSSYDGHIIKNENKIIVIKSIAKYYSKFNVGKNEDDENVELYSIGGYDVAVVALNFNGTVDESSTKIIGGSETDQVKAVSLIGNSKIVYGLNTSSASLYKKEANSDEATEIENYGNINTRATSVVLDISNNSSSYASSVEGISKNEVKEVISTKDGGYITFGDFSGEIDLGNEIIESQGYKDCIIIKYDKNNQIEWVKTIGGVEDDELYVAIKTSDDGFAIAGKGNVSVENKNLNGYFIIKYNEDGSIDENLTRKIADTFNGTITSITETADGGIAIGGAFSGYSIVVDNITLPASNSIYTSKKDGFIIKYNSDGSVNENLTKKIGNTSNSVTISSIAATEDGGIVAGGYFSGDISINEETITNQGLNDCFVIIYNSDGSINENITKTFGGSRDDQVSKVYVTKDNEIILAGRFTSPNITIGDVQINNEYQGQYDQIHNTFVIKIDQAGNTTDVLSKIEGETWYSKNLKKIIQTKDNGLVLLFENRILKIDEQGNLVANRYIRDYLVSVAELKDNSFILIGRFSYDFNSGDYSINVTANSVEVLIRIHLEETAISNVKDVKTLLGSEGSQEIDSVVKTRDGGFVIGGRFENDITIGNTVLHCDETSCGFVAKFNANGTVDDRFTKVIRSDAAAMVNNVLETADGGIALTGTIEGNCLIVNEETIEAQLEYSYNKYMIKINSEGNVDNRLTKIFQGGFYEHPTLVETNDGGIALVGTFYDRITEGENDLYAKSEYENNYYNVFILKYNTEGEIDRRLTKVIGGEKSTYVNSAIATSDGGIAIAGYFDGTIDSGETILESTGHEDGFILKYKSNGTIDENFTKIIEGDSSDSIVGITELKDGRIVVVAKTNSSNIIIDNEVIEKREDKALITFNKDGALNVNQLRFLGVNRIKSIISTNDGGIAVVGDCYNNITVGNKQFAVSQNNNNGFIIKFDNNLHVEGAKIIGGNKSDYVYSVAQLNSGEYILAGTYESETITEGQTTLTNQGGFDPLLLKVTMLKGAAEQSEVEVDNYRKEYEITTKINKIGEIKGGTISGEDEKPYEVVKYGDNSTKEIIIVPDTNYEILSIKINDEEYKFEITSEDGSYEMPLFENVLEDKNIEVTFCLKDNKITINTKDENGDAIAVSGAVFKLERIPDEQDESEFEIEIETNSEGQAFAQIPFGEYKVTQISSAEGYYKDEDIENIEFSSEDEAVHEFDIVNEKMKKITVHHYLKDREGNLTQTKLVEDEMVYGRTGEEYTTAPNLEISGYELETNNNGEYILPENASGTFGSSDEEVSYYYIENRKVVLTHHYIVNTEIKVPLKKGADEGLTEKRYYGYEGEGYTTEAISEEFLDERYELVEMPENYTGEFNANEVLVTYYYKLVTERFVIIKTSDTGKNLEGAEFRIKGREESIAIGEMTPNGEYYFEDTLGSYISNNNYANNSIAYSYVELDLSEVKGKAKLTVNAEISSEEDHDFGYIYITKSKSAPKLSSETGQLLKISGETEATDYSFEIEGGGICYLHFLYKTDNNNNFGMYSQFIINDYEIENIGNKYTTDENGKIEIDLPLGSYNITETKAPRGYKTAENPVYNIEVEKNGENELNVINEPRETELTIHHYIEGTDTPILLSDGTRASDIHLSGFAGESYNANTASQSILSEINDKYELIQTPDNAVGVYGLDDFELTYYYRRITGQVNIKVLDKDDYEKRDTETPIANTKFGIVYEKLEQNIQLDNNIEDLEYVVSDGSDPNSVKFGFDEINGKYISNNNGKVVSVAQGELAIDLTSLEGTYKLIVNAEKLSGKGSLSGLAVSETPGINVIMAVYSEEEQDYYLMAALQGKVVPARDYEIELEAGKIYYLYMYNAKANYDSTDVKNDKFIINSVDIAKVTDGVIGEKTRVNGELTNSGMYFSSYGFRSDGNGSYISNNQGQTNTMAISKLPIDLTKYDGTFKFKFTADLQADGENFGMLSVNKYGDLTINNIEKYDISQFEMAEQLYGGYSQNEYEIELQGGNTYYLYMVYEKNGDVSEGLNDQLVIRDLSIEQIYDAYLETDENGEAEVTLPTGEYMLVELEPAENYILPVESARKVNIVNEGISELVLNERAKQEPIVNPIYEKPEIIYNGENLPEIRLSDGDTPGTIMWYPIENTETSDFKKVNEDGTKEYDLLKIVESGEYEFTWVFIPEDTDTYNPKTGTETFNIGISDLIISSISITEQPKTTYKYGEDLDLSEGVITIEYVNGTPNEIALDADDVTVTGYDKNTLGEQTLTVEYGGKTTELVVTVEDYIDSIVISTNPEKLSYVKGEELDFSDGKITVIYAVGDPQTIDLDDENITIEGYNSSQLGDQELTIKYEDAEVKITVNVHNDIDTIEVTTLPKTDYVKGQDLDFSGCEITVTYEDGTSGTIDLSDENVVVSGYDKDTLGDQELTVTYTENGVSKETTYVVNVHNNIENIEITTQPEKTDYVKGEELDIDDGKITVIYEDGTSETIDLNDPDVTITGYDKDQIGDQEVTISYGDEEVKLTVNVHNDITGIVITTMPKTDYIKGEDLDISDGVITVTYEDNTTDTINLNDDGVTITGYNKDTLGNQELTVTYTENEVSKEATFNVNVHNNVKEIEITTNPSKTDYIKGEDLDISDGVITVTYEDNTTDTINLNDDDVSITGYNKDELGDQELTISYGDQETTLTINVHNNIDKIDITTKPKTDYIKGQELDLSDGVITVTYEDETTKTISFDNNDVVVAGYDKDQTGIQTITVTYTENGVSKEATFDVNVHNNVKEIEITTDPSKTDYIKGEDLDISDGVITVTYEDNTTDTINLNDDDVRITGYDKDELGDQELTISYGDQETTLTINVHNNIDKIEVTTMPKTDYVKGQELDLSDGVITVTYEDETTKTITFNNNDIVVAGYDKDTLGDQTITVTYTEDGVSKETTFDVNVHNKVTNVEITTDPTKTDYIKGEELDLSDGKITVTYEDGTSETIDLDDENVIITGYNKDEIGEQEITISYREGEVVTSVDVHNNITGIEVTTLPKTDYIKGENLDLSDGIITVTYEDNTTSPISFDNENVAVTGYNKDTLGEQTLTVKYTENEISQETTFNVNVHNDVKAIEITEQPKTTYKYGEELDLSEGKITVTYEDDTTGEINLNDQNVTVEGYDKDTLGEQILTVTYENQTAELVVTVENYVKTIEIVAEPEKTEYLKGEDLDITDGTILVTYADESQEEIGLDDPDVLITGYDKDQTGEQEVTITYGEAETEIIVTVNKHDPIVNPVYEEPDVIYTNGRLPDISLSDGDTPGTITWDPVDLNEITEDGEHEFTWTFTPDDDSTYNETSGTVIFVVNNLNPSIESEITVTKDNVITSTDSNIYYEIGYEADIKKFKGNAKVQTVITLPYTIDEENSELPAGYVYDSENKTITWDEEIVGINTYQSEDETRKVTKTKQISLKYNYPELADINTSLVMNIEVTMELQTPDENNEYVTVYDNTAEETAIVSLEIPAQIIVHHYLRDGGEKIINDEEIDVIIGQNYTTSKSAELSNYQVESETPENYAGKVRSKEIEVSYYYSLIDETVENRISQTASVSGNSVTKASGLLGARPECDIEITKEGDSVNYKIVYNISVSNYKGNIVVTMKDSLGEKIDTTKSTLDGGTYRPDDDMVVWTETIAVDTFANGPYQAAIEKNISVVYDISDVLKVIENKVEGNIETYFPDNYPGRGSEVKRANIPANTVDSTIKVGQNYKIDKEVEVVWLDNENSRAKRPEAVKLQLTANGENTLEGNNLPEVTVTAENEWKYVFEGLTQYDEEGNEIIYSVVETAVNSGELEYYEDPQISGDETIIITNNYRLLDTQVNGAGFEDADYTESITKSNQEVDYAIKYNATVTDYIGEATLTIVDTLPYHLDEGNENIDLDGGNYDDNTRTITWVIDIGHINTSENGDFDINIVKNIKVIYRDIDLTQDNMENTVDAKLEFTETDKKNEQTTSMVTDINVKGTVIIKYVDIADDSELDRETITAKVGTEYNAQQKTIGGYTYVENSGNTTGRIKEGTTNVVLKYTRTPATLTIKYLDENGNNIIDPETTNGFVGDEYNLERRTFDDYDYASVEGSESGELSEETIIIYHYTRADAKVVVRYLEKGTNEELSPEIEVNGKAGDDYEVTRKAISRYHKAEPEPDNSRGKMKKETIYVVFYYEKITAGKVIVKYIDKEEEKGITYKDEETGEEKEYQYEIEGELDEEYTTEEKDILYYEIAEIPQNKTGTITEDEETVIYYYRKTPFNISVDCSIETATVNGNTIKIKEGLTKIDIKEKEIDSSEVFVTYKVKVANTGRLEGTAEVIDTIPDGYEVASQNPDYWTQTEEGRIKTTVELDKGEEKELTVVVKWVNGKANFGLKKNTVVISGTTNPANYKDISPEDDKSAVELTMSIKTGQIQNLRLSMVHVCLSLLCLYLCYLLIDLYRNQKTEKQE